jgi:hypothetical protein
MTSRKAAIFDLRGWKARPLLRIRYGMFGGRVKKGKRAEALMFAKANGAAEMRAT